MAKRYSPLTLVALVGAFALLGYMGARLSQKQALVTQAAAPPSSVHLAGKLTAVAPSERDGKMLIARMPADAAELVDASAHARLATAPPLPSNESVGERTTLSPTASEPLQPTPPAAPSASGARHSGQTGTAAELPSNPADTAGSDVRGSRFAERTAAARQPALGADDKPVEKARQIAQSSLCRAGRPTRPGARTSTVPIPAELFAFLVPHRSGRPTTE
jgi:hypothetical protein